MDNFILEHLKGVSLTKSQERIAHYMLENQYTVCQKSLMEASKEAGVSDASVLRFVRAIGFSGYNDFKTALYHHLTAQASVNAGHGALDLGKRLQSNTDKGGNSFQRYLTVALENVERSLVQISAETYENIASQLVDSRCVYIYGSRATRATADHFARGLRFVRDNVNCIQHSNDIYPALRGGNSEDMLLFLCISRFYTVDVHVCEAAKASGMRLCLLTNTAPSPITKYADNILLTQTVSPSYFNSVLGMSAVCEYLLSLLPQRLEGTQQRLTEIDAYSSDERYPCGDKD